MNPTRSDWLLRSTRILLYIAMGAAVIAAIALVIMIPTIWIFSDQIVAEILKAGGSFSSKLQSSDALAGLTAIMAVGLVIIAAAFQFFRKLMAIIDSVGQGSPFIPENAARLRYMGWLVVGVQGFMIACIPLAVWLARVLPKDHDEVRMMFSLDFSWIITALLLFILARVFDHGTRLAEDVEGTV
jgi:Protein of unknown function (DUF2975)